MVAALNRAASLPAGGETFPPVVCMQKSPDVERRGFRQLKLIWRRRGLRLNDQAAAETAAVETSEIVFSTCEAIW